MVEFFLLFNMRDIEGEQKYINLSFKLVM